MSLTPGMPSRRRCAFAPRILLLSAINRNFRGRSGPGSVWLASPPTVAASAIAGELTSFEELQRRLAAA